MRYYDKATLGAVVRGVYLGPKKGEPGYPESFPVERLELRFEGALGDRHVGLTKPTGVREELYKERGVEIRNSRQISIVSAEELAVIADELGLPEVRAEWIGANILLAGVPRFTKIPSGTALVFPSGAVLIVNDENEPCPIAGAAIGRHCGNMALARLFKERAAGFRGVTAWVERPGVIAPGDETTVHFPLYAVPALTGHWLAGGGQQPAQREAEHVKAAG